MCDITAYHSAKALRGFPAEPTVAKSGVLAVRVGEGEEQEQQPAHAVLNADDLVVRGKNVLGQEMLIAVMVVMLMGMFLSGLLQAIPAFAVAPALVIVGAMMKKQAGDINWDDKEMAIPAFITMVLMPFTYSIADGIAWGLISYVAIKIGMGKMDKLNPIVNALAVIMLMFYVGPGDQSTFDWILSAIF